jgi:hypothetical protein
MAAMEWQWRAAILPWNASLAAAVVAGRRAHLFGVPADGGPVRQAAVGPDGVAVALPDLPLISVSGVSAGPGGPLAAGARIGDQAPVLCTVDADSGQARTLDLPTPELAAEQSDAAPKLAAEQSDAAPKLAAERSDAAPKLAAEQPNAAPKLAAWPVPVGGDVPAVVWATGRDPATVHFGMVTPAGLQAHPAALTTRTVWSIQAVPAPGGVEVLYSGASGTAYARIGQNAVIVEPTPIASGAVLCPGAVFTPTGPRCFSVWDTTTGAHRELTLPEPAEGANAQVTAPQLLSDAGLLVWRTEVPDIAESRSSERPVRTVSSRGWVAQLDPVSWQVGPVAQLPDGSTIVVALAGLLVVASTTGAWIGARVTG